MGGYIYSYDELDAGIRLEGLSDSVENYHHDSEYLVRRIAENNPDVVYFIAGQDQF